MKRLTTIRPDFQRNYRKQPLIIPPDDPTGKPIAYTRATTYVSAIEDLYGIIGWKQRLTAIGLLNNPGLAQRAKENLDDTKALNLVCADAFVAGGGEHKANVGTALHELTERIDRGEIVTAPYPPILDGYAVDAILDAYRAATAELKCIAIEERLVLDHDRIAGTCDRIVKYQGETYIADIKTGSIDLGTLKIASQIAVYARSKIYDVTTGKRSIHGASLNRGIVIHLPAVTDPAEARCDLHWIDIETGGQALLTCADIRRKRAIKFKDLTAPFDKPAARVSLRLEKEDEGKAEAALDVERGRARKAIDVSRSPEEVRGCWETWESVWTDELTEHAKARIAQLQQKAS